MPTLRQPPRLLNPLARADLPALFILSVTLVGCAGDRGLRAGAKSEVKTYVAVGDRPFPVVSGESGSAIAADVVASPRIRRESELSQSLISGRVYDADGRPVPGATVRLAVGPAQAGRDNRVMTDPSGGFTLRDLRPGSEYTLIAEWEGDDGLVTGRARALADDNGVRISLLDGAAPVAEGARRINRISDRFSTDRDAREEGNHESGDRAFATPREPPSVRLGIRINEEDLPPAPDAEEIAAGSSVENDPNARHAARPRLGSWQPAGRVRKASASMEEYSLPPTESETGAGGGTGRELAPPRPTAEPPERRQNSSPWIEDDRAVDEGPSPLPPAVEPWSDNVGARSLRSPFDQRRGGLDRPVLAPPAFDPFRDEPPSVALEDRGASPRRRTQGPSRVMPETPTQDRPESRPGALVAVPESYAPILLNGEPYQEPLPKRLTPETRHLPPPAPPRFGSPSRSNQPRSESRSPAEAPTTASPGGAEVENLPDWAFPGVSSNSGPKDPGTLPQIAETESLDRVPEPSRRLTASEPIVTPLGDARPVRPPLAPSGRGLADRKEGSSSVPAADRSPRRPTWGEVASSTLGWPPIERAKLSPSRVALVDASATKTRMDVLEPAATSTAREVSCDYDERHRRVLDFQLPGLDGKSVSFKDLDSDLILLDFWGTWCQPCLKSIPHLVELQKRVGDRRLAVVGIACEQDPPGQSSRRVATLADRLKINYTILLSRNDGSCPLQEALRIHAFPTMILLDRQGRVLWRDQGATPATLARLDRMIATAPAGENATIRR